MNVLLIEPPRNYVGERIRTSMFSTQQRMGIRLGLPLGLLYVAAAARKAGHDVEIFDTLSPEYGEVVFHNADGLIRHGLPDERIKDVIRAKKPRIVGIGNRFSMHFGHTANVARLVKEVDPSILVMLGGNHASAIGDKVLQEHAAFDFCVQGEGEEIVPDLLTALDKGAPLDTVAGLVWRDGAKGGEIRRNTRRPFIQELDDLPFPAYDLVNMEVYLAPEKAGPNIWGPRPSSLPRSVSMVTTRGCPFSCTFCAAHIHMGKKMRVHSVKNVVDHMEMLVKKWDVRHFHMEDDNFTFDQQRVMDLVSEIKRRIPHVTWDTPNGVRADMMSRDLVFKMKEGGCTLLAVGVESGSQRVVQKIIRKALDLDDVERIASACHDAGLALTAFYLGGFPGETRGDIQQTLRYAEYMFRKYGMRAGGIGLVAPLYGTPVYHEAVKKGYLSKEVTPDNLFWSLQGAQGMLKTGEFTPQDIKEADEQLRFRLNRMKLRRDLRKAVSQPGREIMKTIRNPRRIRGVARFVYKAVARRAPKGAGWYEAVAN